MKTKLTLTALLIGLTGAYGNVLDPLTVEVASKSATSITLNVIAGAAGAPSGFVVLWNKATTPWPDSVLTYGTLSPFGSTLVTLSDGNYCPLECGTRYAFRVMALPTTAHCQMPVFDVVAEKMPCPSAPTVSRLRWSTPPPEQRW
jgi:hypothetical protein